MCLDEYVLGVTHHVRIPQAQAPEQIRDITVYAQVDRYLSCSPPALDGPWRGTSGGVVPGRSVS